MAKLKSKNEEENGEEEVKEEKDEDKKDDTKEDKKVDEEDENAIVILTNSNSNKETTSDFQMKHKSIVEHHWFKTQYCMSNLSVTFTLFPYFLNSFEAQKQVSQMNSSVGWIVCIL